MMWCFFTAFQVSWISFIMKLMNTVLTMLLIMIQGTFIDHVDRDIAVQLIENAYTIESLSLSQLAEKCQCSSATIHKFCKKLGFEDFRRLKAQMLLTMNVRREQMKEHITRTDPEAVLARIRELSGDSFQYEEFSKVMDMYHKALRNAKRVLILGAGYPQALSLHYQEDMIMLGKPVYPRPVGYKLEIPAADPQTVILVISLTGRMVDYFRQDFIDLSRKFEHVFLLSSRTNFPELSGKVHVLPFPMDGDDEGGNTLLVEILRYMKLCYYRDAGVVV